MDVDALLEREKELRCLYRVQQLTLHPTLELEDVFLQIVETLGPGWRRPETTGARIEYFGRGYQGSLYSDSSPQLEESLKLGGQEIGRISVSDSYCEVEESSEEAFLPEERHLLKSVAALVSNFLEWRHLEVLGKRLASTNRSHSQWREDTVSAMIRRFDADRFGGTEFYLGGSTQSGQASHGSDIDLFVYHQGTQSQRNGLELWLEGWSLSVAEMARVQLGENFRDGIFHLHWINEPPNTERFSQLRKLGEKSIEQNSTQPGSRHTEVEEMVQRTLLGLSHELRNPLTVVSTNLDLLGQDIPSELRRQTVQDVQQAVAEMSALLSDLVLFLRAETGIEKPVLEETDLAAFVKSALEQIRRKAEQTEIVFVDQESPSSTGRPMVRLNRKITERILREVVNNAVRYSCQGQVRVSVLFLDDGKPAILVEDEGRGIEEVHLERLFEQFYRLESSRDRATGGVGLGLPLAQALAKSQNSLLRLSSLPNKGTQVWLIFQRG